MFFNIVLNDLYAFQRVLHMNSTRPIFLINTHNPEIPSPFIFSKKVYAPFIRKRHDMILCNNMILYIWHRHILYYSPIEISTDKTNFDSFGLHYYDYLTRITIKYQDYAIIL